MSVIAMDMRVLYVIETLKVGGSERSILEISSAFEGAGKEGSTAKPAIHPVLCHLYPGDALKQEYIDRGIPVVSLDIPGKYSFVQAIARLVKVIKEQRPDIIHSTLIRADIVARVAGRLCGIPVVSSFVNDNYAEIHFDSLTSVGRLKHRGLQLIDGLTAHLATAFAANSATLKRSHARALLLREEKIRVIYRGRRPERFGARPQTELARLKSSLGIPDDAQVVLNVARLLSRKGQNDLLAAARNLRPRHPRLRFLIAGEGPHRGELERRIDELELTDCVKLLGTRNDIPELLQLADIFVSLSEYEGHPGAVIEAMLSSRPVLLSDISVHRETISDGESGRLFRLHDVTDLTNKLSKLLDDPAGSLRLGKVAREVAEIRFDVKRIAAEHEAFYRKVLGIPEGSGDSGSENAPVAQANRQGNRSASSASSA